MSKFFSLKLYLEGLKKSRLQGITICAIVTALTALVPLVQLLTPVYYYEPGYVPPTQIIGTAMFAIPLVLILFLTPILTLTMFSFLNKRNESDFYHSIPFTRPCVYFSFLASTLTWLTATLLLALSVTTILWIPVPYTAFSLTTPLLIFGAYFLAILLLTGFTVLAMTLTGTLISNLLIFVLLFGFLRVGGALFMLCLENRFPLMVTALTPARFLLAEFSMPLGLLASFIGESPTVFTSIPLWIYTAVVSVLLIAAGCIVYTKRRSEMAGKSAPNRILQHVYRCAITMPMAFITAFFIIEEGFEPEMLLVLIVLTLLVYFLYEILTTKRLKNCLKATLFLPIIVAGGLLFGGSISLAENVAASYSPAASELKSVSMYKESQYSSRSYEEIMTQTVEITDQKVLAFISEKLAEMKKTVSESGTIDYLYPDRYANGWYEDGIYYPADKEQISYADPITLKITEKSGRVCGRVFRLTSEDYTYLINLFSQTAEYKEALLALPKESEILDIWAPGTHSLNDDAKKLWNSFVKEYNLLSPAEKVEYKSRNGFGSFTLDIRGSVGVGSFYSTYPLDTQYFPETCKILMQLGNREDQARFDESLQYMKQYPSTSIYLDLSVGYDQYYSTNGQAQDFIEALEFAEGCQVHADKNAILLQVHVNTDISYCLRYYYLSQKDFERFCDMANIQLMGEVMKPVEIID